MRTEGIGERKKMRIVSPKARLHAPRDDNATPAAPRNRFPGPHSSHQYSFRCSVSATTSGVGYFAATKLLSANAGSAGFALLKNFFGRRVRRSGTLAKRRLQRQHESATDVTDFRERGVCASSARAKRAQQKTALTRARFQSRMRCGSERVDARGKTREFARGGVPMQHAFGDAAMEFGLRGLERGARGFLVAGRDRGLDFLHRRADARQAHVVDDGALHGLARALFRRLDV